jgi:hypothetical protein
VWKEKTAVVDKENSSWKRTSGDAGLEVEKASDLMDTASSPLKSADEGGGSERTGAKAKKQLMLGYMEDNSVEGIPPPHRSTYRLRSSRSREGLVKEEVISVLRKIMWRAPGRSAARSNELLKLERSWCGHRCDREGTL